MSAPTPDFRGSLLIIDDEEEILKSLYRQFRRTYDVHRAGSAQEGLDLMATTPVHVIVSDQRMPGMTGSEFYQTVSGEYPDAMRLLLTGYADINAVIQAINDGNVFRYITKPWDPVELDTIVREAFERYRLILDNRDLVSRLEESNATLERRVVERTAELADANTTLERVNEQKDQFLGMAAHDLRNPLSAISGFTQLLVAGAVGPVSDRQQTLLNKIDRSSGFMLRLVEDLLDISKIESGRLDLQVAPADLSEIIRRTVELHEHHAASKSIVLELGTLDLGEVEVDAEKIEQVVSNLVSNAIKYSPPEATVTVSGEREGDVVRFSIRDRGQGIPEAEREAMFQPFGKTSVQSTAGEKSTGLGLAIVRRIVEGHGGRIGVDSTVGEGSTFSVTLPLAR